MRFCLALVQLPHQRSRLLRHFQEEDRIQAMAKGPQGAIPVAPSLCSFAGPSWRFRLGPQEMNLSAATLLSQSVETLPPPIPTCHSHDCKLADPRKLPGPSTCQRWYCLPSNQARIRGIEHHQLLSLQPSLRPTAHEYRSLLCLLKPAEAHPPPPPPAASPVHYYSALYVDGLRLCQ